MLVHLDCFPLPAWVIVTSPFGMRWGRQHRGVDFGSPNPAQRSIFGEVVRAPFAGSHHAGYQDGGAGWWSWVEADDGRATFRSFHHSTTIAVPGQHVDAGDPIAHVGTSGASTGAHAHLELWVNGTPIDPLSSLLASKIPAPVEDDMPSQEYFEVKFAELHQHVSKERETLMSELGEAMTQGLRGNVLTLREVQQQLAPIAAKVGVELPALNVND